MNDLTRLIIYICVMAGVTYLIRMIPMALVRKKLKSPFIKSFLFYVPYAVLAAMTFPAVFTVSQSTVASVIGCITAVILALKDKSLLTVALSASAVVFTVEWIIRLMF